MEQACPIADDAQRPANLIGLPAMPTRISAAIPTGQNKNAHCGQPSEPRPPGQTAEQSRRLSLVPQDISSRAAGPRTPFDGSPCGSADIRSAGRALHARPFPNESCPPIPDFASDIYPLNLVVESALSAAGILLQVIRDVHLVGTALVLGFSRTISSVSHRGRHRPLPHFSS